MQKTSIEYCALLAEIVGAIAVVISVIYLAMEVNDNTSELQTQGHYHALSLAQRPLELLIADPALAEIIEAGYAAPERLPAAEWHRFAMYHIMAFNAWEYLYYAQQANSIPANLWTGADAYYRELVSTKPSLAKFWNEYEHVFDEPFRGYAERAFASGQGSNRGNSAAMLQLTRVP